MNLSKYLTDRLRRIERLTYPMGIHRTLQGARSEVDALFLWVPKTAGTSMWATIERGGGTKLKTVWAAKHCFSQRGIVTFGHMSYQSLLAEGIVSPYFHNSAFKFTFVRNPYDRAVSLFEYLKEVQRLPKAETFSDFCTRLQNNDVPDIGLYNSVGISQCNPQVKWLCDREGNIVADYVGKFENFEQDFQCVRKKLQITRPLEKLNTSQRRLTEEYFVSERLKEIIDQYYHDDFHYFGYQKQICFSG